MKSAIIDKYHHNYVANYGNKLRLFTHEVGMRVEIPDHMVVYISQENDVISQKITNISN